MSFCEEINEARMKAYKATLGGEWEKELDVAHEAVKAHLMQHAKMAIKYKDMSHDIFESTDPDFPTEARGLGRQLTIHLIHMLREDGLEVETFQDRGRYAFRVKLPEMPSLIREALEPTP